MAAYVSRDPFVLVAQLRQPSPSSLQAASTRRLDSFTEMVRELPSGRPSMID